MTAIDAKPKDGQNHSDHDDHDHHDLPFQAHHFDTPKQQYESVKLGMWLFLGTEILFFGALFALYTILRANDPEVFSYASQYLDTMMGGVNTAVLILSSLSMAAAVHYAQRSKQTMMLACLWLTLLGAMGFLVIKYFEYEHKFHVNLKWGPSFYLPVDEAEAMAVGEDGQVMTIADENAMASADEMEEVDAIRAESLPELSIPKLAAMPPVDAVAMQQSAVGPGGLASIRPGKMVEAEQDTAAQISYSDQPHLEDKKLPVNTHRFFAIYYAMTGLHGIHVVVGMVMIGWLILRGMKGHFNSKYYAPVDLGGLYWHIVDLVWIFLFPLFYLIH